MRPIAEPRPSRSVVGAVYRRLTSAGSILCFHDVTASGASGRGSAHVSIDAFTEIVDAIGCVSRIVPLTELLDRHEGGRSTAGLVALTFDDAYVGLLRVGDLVQRGLPITIFALTGEAHVGRTFWWDRVDAVQPRVSAARWRAFEDACGVPAAYRSGQPPEFGPVRPLRQWILARYAGRWPDTLEPALAELEREGEPPDLARGMTFEELARLAARGPVDIAVHTRSHPVLPLLPDNELRNEIVDCHDVIRARFASAVAVLAAPYGLYDARTLRIARESGMRAVLTLSATTLRQANGDRAVPRFCVMHGAPLWKLQLAVAGVTERVNAVRRRAAPRYPDLPSATT